MYLLLSAIPTTSSHEITCSGESAVGTKYNGGAWSGNKPDIARKAAEESIDLIQDLLSDGTRMAFITAVWVEAPVPEQRR
jgi:cell division GTPase FtsZ